MRPISLSQRHNQVKLFEIIRAKQRSDLLLKMINKPEGLERASVYQKAPLVHIDSMTSDISGKLRLLDNANNLFSVLRASMESVRILSYSDGFSSSTALFVSQ